VRLAVFTLVLLGMGLVMHFPEGNEYKIVRLLLLPAGVLAGAPLVAFFRRLRLHAALSVLVAALFLLPGNGMALWAYLSTARAKVPIREEGERILLTDSRDDRKEAYRILRDETPGDAVVVVNPEDRIRSVGGYMQGDEVPALARRPLYTGYAFYLTERHPGFEDRLERSSALFQGRDGPLPRPVEGRPLYVLVRSDTVPARLEGPGFEAVFKGRGCALYRVPP
jgi:hypothetical protein